MPKVDDNSLVGVWQGDDSRYIFGEDGSMDVVEDGVTYQLDYEFDGALLLKIQRKDGVEYVDYYYVYLGEKPERLGIVHYEYIHLHVTGNYWDPEIMTFSREAAQLYFTKYIESFKASGEPLSEWFSPYQSRSVLTLGSPQ